MFTKDKPVLQQLYDYIKDKAAALVDDGVLPSGFDVQYRNGSVTFVPVYNGKEEREVNK